MKYHLEPIQFIIRGYTEGSWENTDPYDTVMNVFRVARDEAYIFAAHGKITQDIRQKVRELLAPYGITKFKFHRKEMMKFHT